MANLGQIATTPDGTESILTNKGWVPNTPALEQASAMGGTGAFLTNMLESVTLGAIEAPEALDAISPVASMTGYLLPDVAGLAGIAKGAARLGIKQGIKQGTMADRVASKGSMFKTEQGFQKLPSDIVPGPFAGSARAIEAGVGAIPVLRIVTDMFKIQRQNHLGGKLQRALGFTEAEIKASGGKLLPDAFQAPLQRVDAAYDSARGFLDDTLDASQIRKVTNEAAKEGLLTPQQVKGFTTAKDAPGAQILDLRSQLRGMQRTADTQYQRQRISEIIDNIQDIINDATQGTAIAPELAKADKVYKLWKTVDDGAAIAADGTINFRSLQNALNKSYGSRAVKGGRGVADPLVDDLIKSVDELGQLGPAIPSSGTAERAAAASIVGSVLGVSALN